MTSLPPGTIMLVGALALTVLRGRWLKVGAVVLPIASLAHLAFCHPAGQQVTTQLFDYDLVLARVDQLSLVWGYVFHAAAILAAIYGWHERSRVHHLCAAAYVGSAIGAVFAGDLLTLFVYWEITAVTSVFLVWQSDDKDAVGAGLRYAFFHIGSGVLVLSGAIVTFLETGSLQFGGLGEVGVFHELNTYGSRLLLMGFGIKAGFPLVHAWIADAYAKARPAGTVVLSAFTTKMAIYALARGFAGAEVLVLIGSFMCIIPLIHAVLADDLRQTLAHVLNNQLGFMVVAVGVGTPLAIDGVAAMAVAHVIYKGLLFMAIGTVLFQVGTARQSQLGGLARRMPWTCGCCLIAACSVFPLNCAFVTKSLVLSAVAEHHLEGTWLLLIIAAAGAFLTAGLKVPYFAFFGPSESRLPAEPAPLHMRLAMVASAALCLGIGCFPHLLYARLPFGSDYHPYTLSHLVQQFQLLSCTSLVFGVMVWRNWYPQPVTGTLLDVDWLYRTPIRRVAKWWQTRTPGVVRPTVFGWLHRARQWSSYQCSEAGWLGRSASTNAMAFAAIILLAVYLLVYY